MSVPQLYQSIQERWRPEDVLRIVLELQGDTLSPKDRNKLTAAAGRVRRSSMSSIFAKADEMTRQIKIAETVFNVKAPKKQDPAAIKKFIGTLKGRLGVEGTDFKAHRLNHNDRKATRGVSAKGHRAYNKQFRCLARLVDKYERCAKVSNLKELAQIAKNRLASRIEEEDFSSDLNTACFIAYLTARLNVRSTFTFGKQDPAYDTNAEVLFNQLTKKANWLAIAHVYPSTEVLGKLSEGEKGRLLGEWFAVMVRAVHILKNQTEVNKLDLVHLVVKRGNDSSTWNEAAGAFNKAREGWMNTLYSLEAESLLDSFAPSKALRLMAADVVAGHKHYGSGGLEPDTAVWGALPKPWEVILGGVSCTRDDIEAACKKFDVQGKGWIKPRPKTIAKFKPTPELVHGVIVSSPELAATLKSLGYFSGPSKSKGQPSEWVPIIKELKGATVTVREL